MGKPKTLPQIQSPKALPPVLLMVEENVTPICAKLRVRCAERKAASLGASQASFDFSISDVALEARNYGSIYSGSSWFAGRCLWHPEELATAAKDNACPTFPFVYTVCMQFAHTLVDLLPSFFAAHIRSAE